MGYLERHITGGLSRHPNGGFIRKEDDQFGGPCCCGSDSSSSLCDLNNQLCNHCQYCTTPQRLLVKIRGTKWTRLANSPFTPGAGWSGVLDGDYVLCKYTGWYTGCAWRCTIFKPANIAWTEPNPVDLSSESQSSYSANDQPDPESEVSNSSRSESSASDSEVSFNGSLSESSRSESSESDSEPSESSQSFFEPDESEQSDTYDGIFLYLFAEITDQGMRLYVRVARWIHPQPWPVPVLRADDLFWGFSEPEEGLSYSSASSKSSSSEGNRSTSSHSSVSDSSNSSSQSHSTQSESSGSNGGSMSESSYSSPSSQSSSSHSSSSSSSHSSSSSSSPSSTSSEPQLYPCDTKVWTLNNISTDPEGSCLSCCQPISNACWLMYDGTAEIHPLLDAGDCCQYEWPSSNTSSSSSGSGSSESSSSESRSSRSSLSSSSDSTNDQSESDGFGGPGGSDDPDDSASASDSGGDSSASSVDSEMSSPTEPSSASDGAGGSESSEGCAGCGSFTWGPQGGREPADGGLTWVRYSDVVEICTNGSTHIRIDGSSDDFVAMIPASDRISVVYETDPYDAITDPVTFILPHADKTRIFRSTAGHMMSMLTGGPGEYTVEKTFYQLSGSNPNGYNEFTYEQGSPSHGIGQGSTQWLEAGNFTTYDWGSEFSVSELGLAGMIDQQGILRFRFAFIPSGSGYVHVSAVSCVGESSDSSSGGGSTCYQLTSTPGSGTTVLFNGGASFPAGNYRVNYIEGSINYHTGGGPPNDGHTVNLFQYLHNSEGIGHHVRHSGGSGTRHGPGTGNVYATEAEVEAASSGSYVVFTHTGGTIGIQLNDSNFADNTGDGVTFELCPTSLTEGPDCPADFSACCAQLDVTVSGGSAYDGVWSLYNDGGWFVDWDWGYLTFSCNDGWLYITFDDFSSGQLIVRKQIIGGDCADIEGSWTVVSNASGGTPAVTTDCA